MNILPHGRLFAVPLPDGTYVFGRILLDIYGTLKRRLFPADSPLPFYGQAHLIEMYSKIAIEPEYIPSRVLIPGAFVESKEIGKKWPIIGEQLVNPQDIEFPEYLIGAGVGSSFCCGEMDIPLPFKEPDLRKMNIYGARHSAFLWPYVCLWALGRQDEIPSDYKTATLERSDLRFSSHRARVYEHLPFTMEQSYFEKQAKLSLHFERLYE